LDAYARGFEAMAAVATPSHPALYNGGWHPTSVCGVVGAATAAARLLDLSERRRRNAVGIALLRAGGLQSAFGSQGKSLQVGLAASSGVWAARAAASGASVTPKVWEGFERAYGATWAEPDGSDRAADQNWIKAYPCCLQTHAAIEAAQEISVGGTDNGEVRVVVHPVSRKAAPYDDVQSGLEAKFSIPYLVAYTMVHGPPTLASFKDVDDAVREVSRRVEVEIDAALAESETIIRDGSGRSIRVEAALGSPQRPMSTEELATKVKGLAGDALVGILESPTPGQVFLELLEFG
jgi:2-methylcitrate dehydratase PrpD